jgi:hypothetical protein
MSTLEETGYEETRLDQCIRWYREEYPSIRDKVYHEVVAHEAAAELDQLRNYGDIWQRSCQEQQRQNEQLRLDLATAKATIEKEKEYSDLLHKGNSHLRYALDAAYKILLAVRDRQGNNARNASDAATWIEYYLKIPLAAPAAHPAESETK